MRILLQTLIVACLLSSFACATRSVPMLRANGNEAHDRGDYSRAIDFHREVNRLSPGRAQYRFELGRSLLANGQAGEASEQLAIAHDLAPENIEYLTAYAEALVATGDLETLTSVLGGRARRSAAVEDYLLLGEFLGRAGDPDGQEQALLSAADVAGRTTDKPQRALAKFYESTERTDSAIRRWRMVLWFDVLDPEASAALNAHGVVPGPTAALMPLGRAGR